MKSKSITFSPNDGGDQITVRRWQDGTAYLTMEGPRGGLRGGIPLSVEHAEILADFLTDDEDDDLTAPCHDCGINTLPLAQPDRAEYYMVQHAIWDEFGPDKGYMCIGCLETRMGRKLNSADFLDVPVNDLAISDTERYAWSWRTPRLINRLERTNA
jgi:hypothetical protein